jgi:hypothetical protein
MNADTSDPQTQQLLLTILTEAMQDGQYVFTYSFNSNSFEFPRGATSGILNCKVSGVKGLTHTFTFNSYTVVTKASSGQPESTITYPVNNSDTVAVTFQFDSTPNAEQFDISFMVQPFPSQNAPEFDADPQVGNDPVTGRRRALIRRAS